MQYPPPPHHSLAILAEKRARARAHSHTHTREEVPTREISALSASRSRSEYLYLSLDVGHFYERIRVYERVLRISKCGFPIAPPPLLFSAGILRLEEYIFRNFHPRANEFWGLTCSDMKVFFGTINGIVFINDKAVLCN